MKKIVQNTGLRQLTGDDLLLLQKQALMMESFYQQFGDFIFYGCEKQGNKYTPGLLLINGKYTTFEGYNIPDGQEDNQLFVKHQELLENVPYKITNTDVGYSTLLAVPCNEGDEAAICIDTLAKEPLVKHIDDTKKELEKKADKTQLGKSTKMSIGGSFNDYKKSGTYYIDNDADLQTIALRPCNVAGFMNVISNDIGWVSQMYISAFSAHTIYMRRLQSNGVWTGWQQVSDWNTIANKPTYLNIDISILGDVNNMDIDLSNPIGKKEFYCKILSGTLKIVGSLASPFDKDNKKIISFYTGTTPPTLNINGFPIIWANGATPIFNPNKSYRITFESIVGNKYLATCVEFF